MFDNPAERDTVGTQVTRVSIPKIGTSEQYIRVLKRDMEFAMMDSIVKA